MYGIVTKAQGQTVLANLGRIDTARTDIFFRAYMTDAERRVAVFSHGDDGSIRATLPERIVEVIVDPAEAVYFRAQRLYSCGTMSPGRKPAPTWAEAPVFVRAHDEAVAGWS